jgi:hypothetical protein
MKEEKSSNCAQLFCEKINLKYLENVGEQLKIEVYYKSSACPRIMFFNEGRSSAKWAINNARKAICSVIGHAEHSSTSTDPVLGVLVSREIHHHDEVSGMTSGGQLSTPLRSLI